MSWQIRGSAGKPALLRSDIRSGLWQVGLRPFRTHTGILVSAAFGPVWQYRNNDGNCRKLKQLLDGEQWMRFPGAWRIRKAAGAVKYRLGYDERNWLRIRQIENWQEFLAAQQPLADVLEISP